jgi:HPt (histidine-containing phosphotransfer) domain-containing protein
MESATQRRGGAPPPKPDDVTDRLIYQLLADADGEVEEVRELVEFYLQAATERVGKIRHAVTTNDANAVKFAAHDLKSSSAAFGALRVARVAAQLETDARAGHVSEALAQELQAAFAEAEPAIRHLMDTLAAA